MTPEGELLRDLLEQADRSASGLDETLRLLADFPDTQVEFENLPPLGKVVSLALLKQVEQLEGSLHGAFRVSLRILGVSLKGLYPLDIGNRMAELDVVDDGAEWLAAVKLRNELVHEYPDTATARFTRTRQAFLLAPKLQDALRRLHKVAAERAWLVAAP